MSIARAFRVIDYLAGHGPSSLRGLARELDLPLGSAHRLLTALAAEDVVARTATDEWELASRVLRVAGAQLERLALPKVARPELEALAERTGSTSFLAIRSGTDVVYVDKVQTAAQVQLYVGLGARRPLHCTALGKVMLAFMPEAHREDVLARLRLARATPHTITDADQLRRELAGTRVDGFATDREEAVIGVHCVAAPLVDLTGAVVGAMSVAGTDPSLSVGSPGSPGSAGSAEQLRHLPAIRSNPGSSLRSESATLERGRELAELVVAAAARVSGRLGAPSSEQFGPPPIELQEKRC